MANNTILILIYSAGIKENLSVAAHWNEDDSPPSVAQWALTVFEHRVTNTEWGINKDWIKLTPIWSGVRTFLPSVNMLYSDMCILCCHPHEWLWANVRDDPTHHTTQPESIIWSVPLIRLYYLTSFLSPQASHSATSEWLWNWTIMWSAQLFCKKRKINNSHVTEY